jgi:hypothetical protein
MPIIPALDSMMQEDREVKANLDHMARTCLNSVPGDTVLKLLDCFYK